VDFGPEVESTSGSYAREIKRFPNALYKTAGHWEQDQLIKRTQSNKIIQLSKNQVKQQHENNKSSRRKQRRGKPTRSKIATSRRLGLVHQESTN